MSKQNHHQAEAMEQIAMQIILHSGNAKSNLILALRSCKGRQFAKGRQLIDEAEQMLIEAHKTHVDLIQKEAGGEKTELSLLLMHAEDQLMTVSTMKELIKELLDLFEHELKK